MLEKTPLNCKEIQPVYSEGDQPWDFFGRNDAKAETPVLWPPHAKSWLIGKRLWCWEGLGAGGEGDNRGWDGWMASLTWWTWVWVNSRSWWRTGKPGVLQFMGSQRVGHDWVTELKISWIWSLYREILVISPLQSHYLNRWRSFRFWNELWYLFSYKFVPADLSLKFWFSSFSHISSWKTWFPWVYLLSTGERPGVDQAGKKVTNIWFQNCDQPEQIAEDRWDVQSWSTVGPSG